MQTLEKTQRTVRFVGTLTQVQYKSGQPCVQLVFKSTGSHRLALNSDAQVLRSLKVGKSYRVKGPERVLGTKTYVFEPSVTYMPLVGAMAHSRRVGALGVVACVAIGGMILTDNRSNANYAQAATVTEQTTTADPVSTTPKPTVSTQPSVPGPVTPPVTAPAKATTVKKTAVTPAPTPVVAPAPVVAAPVVATPVPVTPPVTPPPATDPTTPPVDPVTPPPAPTTPTTP